MPARDSNKIIEFLGKLILILSAALVLIHGGLRIFSTKKNKQEVK